MCACVRVRARVSVCVQSVLAMIANTGVRSPINVYKTIAVKFKVSVL